MKTYLQRLGLDVRKRRRAMDITQGELAALAGCTTSHLSRVERGRCDPSIALLSRLAHHLGADLATMMSQPGPAGEATV